MANEYLQRTPTSTGNRSVWTWSAWIKRNTISDWMRLFNAQDGLIQLTSDNRLRYRDETSATDTDVVGTEVLRDTQSWYHILVYVNSTTSADNRVGLYVNGKRITEYSTEAYGTQPELGFINSLTLHTLGCRNGSSEFFDGQMSDVFFVDGTSLLPDTFGFYKEGKGYQSSGTTNATDFRPGQWVPKAPRTIKTEINRRGGFGVNGFYLPMNDISNVGADFHTTPNSIITLKGEDLPQPRNGAPTTTDAYVSQLRQEAGTLGFDGVVKFDGSGDYLSVVANSDLQLGTDDFTIEAYINLGASISSQHQTIIAAGNPESANSFVIQVLQDSDGQNPRALNFRTDARSITSTLGIASNEWTHIAVTKESNVVKLFINGAQRASGTESESLTTAITAIGYRVASSYGYYNGFISNLRVVKGTALYTANFTAPTEPLTNVTNTVLLCCNSSTSATAATVTPGTITANGDVLATRNELTGSIVLAVPGISTATGANLITNGTFENGTSGWTAQNSVISVNSNNQLVVDDSANAGTYSSANQTITTEVGKRYVVSYDLVAASGTSNLSVYSSGWAASAGDLAYTEDLNSVAGTRRNVSFTATTTSTTISLQTAGTSNSTYDNVVVKQEDAPRDYSADIKGSGSNKTLTPNGNAGVGYEIPSYYGSAMSFDGTGDYLSVPDSSDLELGAEDFTIEFWRKNNQSSLVDTYVSKYERSGNNPARTFWFGTAGSNNDGFYWYSGSNSYNIQSPANSYTTNQWDHLCAERYNGVITLYVNGVAVNVDSSANAAVSFNNTAFDLTIGGSLDNGAIDYYQLDGYLQDLRIYKGVAKYKGGFDVPKPYTPVGFEGDSWRTVADCTANNFATLNSIGSGLLDYDGDSNTSATYSNGNLTAVLADNAASARSTIGIHTGKWYWETRIDVNSNSCGVGIVGLTTNSSSYSDVEGASYEPRSDRFRKAGTTFYDGTNNYTDNGLIVGIALDKNVGIISFFADGTLQSSGTMTGLNALSKYHLPECFTHNDASSNTFTLNYGQNPTFSGQVTAGTNADDSGKGLFKYAPPSGFLALCEDNLPAPAIADPGDYFKTVLYTGSDDNGGKSITGVGFKPDFVWVKNRNISSGHYLWDVVRGTDANLRSDDTFTEVDVSAASNGIISTNASDGFVVKNGGTSGTNVGSSGNNSYVAWCWKAGGAAVSNTDGSIPSQVSANQDAGFSIVSYTGTGANATVGHELGKKPSFIVVKERYSPSSSISSWQVYHSSLGATQRIQLNLTNTADTVSNIWNDTEPTSDVFTIGSSGAINENTGTYIAYCWAEIEGFSKFGSYVSNGDADGPFVYCGFKPAFIIRKRSTNTGGWYLTDSARNSSNPVNTFLDASDTDDDGTGTDVDFLSNGFKLRNADSGTNSTSYDTYIFMAFAESPFKTANSK